MPCGGVPTIAIDFLVVLGAPVAFRTSDAAVTRNTLVNSKVEEYKQIYQLYCRKFYTWKSIGTLPQLLDLFEIRKILSYGALNYSHAAVVMLHGNIVTV